MKYALVITVLFLIGCEDVSTNKQSIGVGEVKEIKLSDGTKCAIFDGYENGGISCNWK